MIAPIGVARFIKFDDTEAPCCAWLMTVDTNELLFDFDPALEASETKYFKGQVEVRLCYGWPNEVTRMPTGEYGIEVVIYTDMNPGYINAVTNLVGEETLARLKRGDVPDPWTHARTYELLQIIKQDLDSQ